MLSYFHCRKPTSRQRTNRPRIRQQARRRFFRPQGEMLESRQVLSTETWSGDDSNDSFWTSNDNWDGIGGAGADDDLIFPSVASRLTNNNDFDTNTSFSSLTFNGNAYNITGNQIILTGGIVNNPSGGGSPPRFAPNILLGSSQTFNSLNSHVELDGVVNLDGHSLTLTGAGDHRFDGAITDGGQLSKLVKNGSGTAHLFANSALAPELDLNAGTAVIEASAVYNNTVGLDGGSLIVHGAANFAILNGGTLRGTGTVGGINTAANGGTVAPGNTGTTTGILTSTGFVNLSQNSSTLAIDLNGTTVETQHDRLSSNGGDITLTNASLSISLGFTPTIGQTFTIVTTSGAGNTIIGQFAQGARVVGDGHLFGITYNPTSVVLTALGSTLTWDGGGTDNFWSTAANWNPNVAPADGVDLVFPAGVPADSLTNTNNITGLDVRSVAINGANYNITGSAITLSNGLTANPPAGGSAFFLPTITLVSQPQTFTFTGGSGTGLGPVNLNGFGLTIDNGLQVAIGGQISGSGGIIKNGTGQLDLITPTNNYTGVTQINAGKVTFSDANGLGATGAGNNTVVAAGATLQLFSQAAGVPEAITLNGTGVGGTGALLGGNCATACSISGAITLGSESRVGVNQSESLTLNGAIGGGFGLTKVGAGTLTLGGSSPLAGSVQVSDGKLLVTGSLTAVSSVDVLAGAVLGGNGAINGPVNINAGGHLAPGTTTGILGTDNLTLSAGSVFDAEITSDIVGQFDGVIVNGAVAIATTGDGVLLNIAKSGTLNLQNGDQLAIIDNDGSDAVTGTFKNLPEGANLGSNFLGSGLTAKISYNGFTGTQNDVVLTMSPGSLFPWHNSGILINDVSGNGNPQPDTFVAANDVLAVINFINANGSGPVPENAVIGLPFGFLDTKADNQIVAEDVLQIINYINSGRPLGGEAEAHSPSPSLPPDLLLLLATDLASQPTTRRRA